MTIPRSKDWQQNRNKRLGLRNKGADHMRTGSDRPAPMPNVFRIKELADLALRFRYQS